MFSDRINAGVEASGRRYAALMDDHAHRSRVEFLVAPERIRAAMRAAMSDSIDQTMWWEFHARSRINTFL